MDKEIKRTIILENYQNPKHKGLIDDSSYKKINTNSESCIDEIDLMMKIEDGKIKDVRFDGEACAICTSSTSIMTTLLIGKAYIEIARRILGENIEVTIPGKDEGFFTKIKSIFKKNN